MERKNSILLKQLRLTDRFHLRKCIIIQFNPVSSGYANETLNGFKMETTTISILTEGTHTITIKQENEPIMEAYRYALLLQQHITDFQLEITKITGSDVDTERNWKMTKYIPEIPEYLNAYETVIQHIRYLLQDYSRRWKSMVQF